MPLRILDTGLAAARWNVAMTAALVDGHADGMTSDTVRFHRYLPCVLLGNGQDAASAADLDYCRFHDIGIARRVTGGGAVFMSPRMLAWDVVIALKTFGGDIGIVTRRICDAVAGGLSSLGVPARFRAPNDIEIGGRKISGSSGYVSGRSAVLQGTVLIEDDLTAMSAALRIRESAVRDKVACLAFALGAAPAIETVQDRIAAGLAASLGYRLEYAKPGAAEMCAADALLRCEAGAEEHVIDRHSSAAAEVVP